MVGWISGGWGEECRALVSDFVERSKRNHLLLNVVQTREMVVDLRRNDDGHTAPEHPGRGWRTTNIWVCTSIGN